MKKTTLTLSFLVLFSFGVFAQADLPNIIKINPISLAFGNFNLSYQRALSDASALQIGANYWYKILGVALMLPLIICFYIAVGGLKMFLTVIGILGAIVLMVVAFAAGIILIIES